MTIKENILAPLVREAGLKGRKVAQLLGVEKSVVNSALLRLKTRRLARQDAAYRWWLIQPEEAAPTNQRGSSDTTLARLCRHYLHCLSLDDEAGVSVFARSQHAPDYVELPVLPDFDPEQRAVASFPGVSALFRRLRTGTSGQVPYLGYPVRLRFHRSAKGWEGFFVEPLLLFEFADDGPHSESGPMLTGKMPTFNSRVVRAFAAGNEQHVMEEAAALAEELGLNDVQDFIYEVANKRRRAGMSGSWRGRVKSCTLGQRMNFTERAVRRWNALTRRGRSALFSARRLSSFSSRLARGQFFAAAGKSCRHQC